MNPVINSQQKNLPGISKCHRKAFPTSLTSMLGPTYTAKTLEWYLTAPNKFLFHLEEEGQVVGYCGGFVRMGEPYGSSSGMTQYAFREGLKALLLRPWLVFHPRIRGNFKFIFRNIRYRFFPPQPVAGPSATQTRETPKEKTAGLVVIGVDPAFQGKGYGSLLLQEFERRAREMGCTRMGLTVEKDNLQAIRAYTRNGWTAGKTAGQGLQMFRELNERF